MNIDTDTASEILTKGLSKEEIKAALEKIYPGAMGHVREILRIIGDNPDREGLKDTPYRVVKSWLEIYGGYKMKPLLTAAFAEDIGDKHDSQIVMCKDIKFYSTCEHHMIPFHGVCHIGYLPGKKVIGVSKLVRITDFFAKRLQIQEKLCSQIADMVEEIIEPEGVGVVMQAQHLCMAARGVRNPTSNMVTSQMRGKFRDQIQTRNEFLELIKL